jgi:hypothetical protein
LAMWRNQSHAWDGACCENTNSTDPVCCLVSLKIDKNTAQPLK